MGVSVSKSGSETEVKIYDVAFIALRKAGIPDAQAQKYAIFAIEVYKVVSDDPRLQQALAIYHFRKGLKDAATAFTYADKATALQLDASAARFAAKGAEGMGDAIGAFVDYFSAFAKMMGVEMNECALCITKVALDALTVVAMTETVVGAVGAALQALSTVKDTRDMLNACFG